MNKLYFSDLIRKYSDTYTVTHKEEGYWDGPDYIEGDEVEYDVQASVFPLTAEDIERYEGLGYSQQDIKVFFPIAEVDDIGLREDDEIDVGDETYILDAEYDRTTHSDFKKWLCKLEQDSDNDD